MARSRELKVVISGDADKLDREVRRSSNSLDKLGKQTRTTSSITSKGFGAMKIGAAGAAAGLAGLALAGKEVTDAAVDAEKSQARLRAQLKASGISYKEHAAEIESVIQKTSRLAGLDDEDLQDAFTNIVRTTGDVNKSLRLTGLAADFARGKQMDVAKAGEIVAKVAGGNIGILGRYGVTVRKGASANEALAALQKKFAGQAKGYGETTAGSVDRANKSFEDLKEKLGGALAPVVADAADGFAKFVTEIQAGTGAGGRFRRTVESMARGIGTAAKWIGNASDDARAYVRRFATDNRRQIASVVTTFRQVGRVAETVFRNVIAPSFRFAESIARRAFPGIRQLVLGMARTIRGVADTIDGIIHGDFRKAFGGIRGIITGPFRAGVGAIRAFTAPFREAGSRLGRALAGGIRSALSAGGDLGKSVVNGLIGLLNRAIPDKFNIPGAPDINLPDNPIPRLARGGYIGGSGRGDIVPAMLEPGEFVIRRAVVDRFGPTFFAGINGGMGAPQGNRQVPGYTSGGIVARANRLDGMDIPYLYGGGHGTRDGFNRRGMDCSASVSYALGISPRTSGLLMGFGRPGPGSPNDTKIYANPSHVFAVFNGRGWGTSRENPGGGPGWLSYNSRPGFTIRHLNDSGEGGSGGGRSGSGSTGSSGSAPRRRLTGAALSADAAYVAGFRGATLTRMVAIASRESGHNPRKTNFRPPDHSIGLWQINQNAHHGRFGSDAELMDPYTNARAAYALFQEAGLNPWRATRAVSRRQLAAAGRVVRGNAQERSESGGSLRGGDSGGGSGGSPAERVSAHEQRIGAADLGIAEAEARSTGETVGGSPQALRQAAAVSAKRRAVGIRIREVRAALKRRGLRAATRHRLTTELAELLGEHRQLGEQGRELRTPPPVEAVEGEGGEDPNQALIDAMQEQTAAIEAAREQAEAEAAQRAEEARLWREELEALRLEEKRGNDIAASVVGRTLAEVSRALADVVSGQLGPRMAPRALLPGAGAGVRY